VIRRAGLVLAGLLFALVVTEIGLRVIQPPERKAHILTDPVRHHRLREKWQGTVQGFPYRTNALGFRERDLATPKPAGLVRVLMLGDSFTEGGGLAEADTIPRRVEVALHASCPGVEVVNAGTASYSPILEYLVLADVAASLAPIGPCVFSQASSVCPVTSSIQSPARPSRTSAPWTVTTFG